MGSKLAIAEKRVLKIDVDFSQTPVPTATPVKVADLPDDFVVQSVRTEIIEDLTATSTLVIGEDGGGDADGYSTDVGSVSVGATLRGNGALLFDATDKYYKEHIVDPAKDGILLTSGVANLVAGKIRIFIDGYQS